MKEIPDLEKIRRRHKDIETEPMFDPPRPTGGERAPKPKRKSTVDSRYCPTCKAKVGTVYEQDRTGRTLVFRVHDRVTYGGHRFRCDSSGVDASEARRAS